VRLSQCCFSETESTKAAANRTKAYGIIEGLSKLRKTVNTPSPPKKAENIQRIGIGFGLKKLPLGLAAEVTPRLWGNSIKLRVNFRNAAISHSGASCRAASVPSGPQGTVDRKLTEIGKQVGLGQNHGSLRGARRHRLTKGYRIAFDVLPDGLTATRLRVYRRAAAQ
jgi:hypothetical protein